MWFDGWSDIVRVVAVGGAAYLTLLVVLRTSGKRTLAKLNAFDLVVTVALGSTLATILLSKDVSWSEGATALAGLVLLQFLVATLASLFPRTRTVVTSRPTLLAADGQLLEKALRDQRVAPAEVRQALRTSGTADLADVAAVVLETDGSLSVIGRDRAGSRWALQDVDGVSTGGEA